MISKEKLREIVLLQKKQLENEEIGTKREITSGIDLTIPFATVLTGIRRFGKNEFYFFDEIQNVNSWERFIRAALDFWKKIVITGSNASLLSKELSTKLTGRHINYTLFPF